MYSLADYGTLIADRARMGAFARALEAAVRPGAVVVDLGTGTGIMALLACKGGARRVFAIEPDDAIQVAREIALLNGCADRIEFIQNVSTQVTLPEPADIIVSDIGGLMPWFHRHIPAVADARRRFLGPGGVMIPARDDVWAVVVEAPGLYARKTEPWEQNAFGLDMSPARDAVLNTWTRGRVAGDAFLSSPQVLATLDYQTLVEPDLDTTAAWTIERPGTGHGLLAGFNRTLADGIHLSNLPGATEAQQSGAVYETVFFPWAASVALETADTVVVHLNARLLADDYVWVWRTRVEGRSGVEKASFSQSTLFGTPLTLKTLSKQRSSHLPRLTAEGRLAQFVLSAMARGLSVGEIAARLTAEFPEQVTGSRDALRRVTALTAFYD